MDCFTVKGSGRLGVKAWSSCQACQDLRGSADHIPSLAIVQRFSNRGGKMGMGMVNFWPVPTLDLSVPAMAETMRGSCDSCREIPVCSIVATASPEPLRSGHQTTTVEFHDLIMLCDSFSNAIAPATFRKFRFRCFLGSSLDSKWNHNGDPRPLHAPIL